MLDAELRSRVRGLLAELAAPLSLHCWTQEGDPASGAVWELFSELAEASSLLSLVAESGPVPGLEPEEQESAVTELRKDGTPTGIRWLGFPGGYEFSSLLETLLAVSRDLPPALPEDVRQRLGELFEPVRLEVFVTPT
jgi:alkyl hydroperoxide reductase subunit AhpF